MNRLINWDSGRVNLMIFGHNHHHQVQTTNENEKEYLQLPFEDTNTTTIWPLVYRGRVRDGGGGVRERSF